jgi:phosphoribosylaminoimidazole-succinocarboxamide synthase
MTPKKLALIYEGKAKKLFSTEDPELVIQYFKDDATAFNKQKYAIIEGKGILNNEISSIIMGKLKEILPTHFIEKLNEREQLVKKVTIFPIEVTVRNIAAGNFVKNFGVESGMVFPFPSVEFYYKKDELGDPAISLNQILVLEIASREQMAKLEEYALKINTFLKEFFAKCGIKLVDFKVEFGLTSKGEIVLADEISPDTCRLRDIQTGKILDKDIFRQELGSLVEGYTEVLNRVKEV